MPLAAMLELLSIEVSVALKLPLPWKSPPMNILPPLVPEALILAEIKLTRSPKIATLPPERKGEDTSIEPDAIVVPGESGIVVP